MNHVGQLHKAPPPAGEKAKPLLDKFVEVRAHTLHIVGPLKTEDFVVQPVVDVSPAKWHMAHTTWFFEEFFLARYKEGYKRFHPRYAFLFNSYYETVGERVLRPDRGNMSRPTVDEIRDYRHHVDHHMQELIPSLDREALQLLELGLNHEQQHQELMLTDIKYVLGHNPLFPPYDPHFTETPDRDFEKGFALMDEGVYEIGFSGEGFHFDNERERHKVHVNRFEISKALATNGEYLEFVESGGYRDHRFWHSDGRAWVMENNIGAPLYWHQIDGKWYRYAMSGLQELDASEPVAHVCFYEASAFAEWAGMRLPTEFEWEVASGHFRWGQRWEHTHSAYLPYPGFHKPEGAIGEYNGKFMVNQMVLRGSSVATPPGHERKTYRNFFHPHLQWQFSGIRLCKK
ncbi:MAG: ergothioneine biosynthesis protein EgtB [Cyclobacteriaceae bacterium]|nr:ergothioneine biosynthesis protein EgtB [Cyclobacteriaceae bacterium]MCB0499341.1 ergothioneine biosynthesis protein EgtB [Cyclobacteriaceae bacterium]MCB9236419.1 ergothioneine biosynthesis protein EgtB [Flammeovirgaceae bacterium]MCW5902120.1 ergothioneine biosynthesis protein EgtB [Cyclobacteriaceae bacterium]